MERPEGPRSLPTPRNCRPQFGYGGRENSRATLWGPCASIPGPKGNLLLILFCAMLLVGRIEWADAKEADLIGQQIRSWAVRFAKDLKVANEVASNYSAIKSSFDKDYKVVPKGNRLFEDITRYLANLVKKKQDSVENLYKETEKLVESSRFDGSLLEIVNAKRLDPRHEKRYLHPDGCTDELGALRRDEEGNISPGCVEKRLDLNYSSYFGQLVSFEKSAIHVATNIYTRAEHVLHAIQMSAGLDNRFRSNRGSDPYLSFQFFCSHTGFLRLYPAVQWPDMDPDMYECRSRSWYVQAAASAKDVVILLDVSGSMTGLRKEIARNVVVNILETLTDNDFVQVLTFKNDCSPLVPCFDQPVQANQRNIREFKEYLNKLDTQNIANFSLALTEAFELLQRFNRSKGGSQCNQAIMLITDGAPSNYQDIFFRYNYPNIPVRVFTYLIGREVTDTREVNWMACSNRGYYTHVTTLAEVREQVLKYIPVMSRPIVLARKHPVIWTAAYPTVTETLLTDNLWEERERGRFKAEGLRNLRRRMQRDSHARDQNNSEYDGDYSGEYSSTDEEYDGEEETSENGQRKKRSPEEAVRSLAAGLGASRGDISMIALTDHLALRPENRDFPESKKRKPVMLTTVAIPVFNVTKGENDTNVTSHLLGVVGIDVPVRELERLASPFQLGVNAYPFILNKNGHLISHPDLRPMFQDLVKPFHSNVDLLEVELLDNQLSARDFSLAFKNMRKNMIDGRRGWSDPHNVRVHMDGMKRVAVRKHRYFFGPVGHSVFSLAIALPQPYGVHGVDAQFELSNPANQKIDVYKTYFEGTDWHVHPNWTYCEDDNAERGTHNNFKGGIDHIQKNAVASLLKAWRSEKNPKFLVDTNRPNKMHTFKAWTCDVELLQSLIFDASRTAPHILEQIKTQSPSNTKSRASVNTPLHTLLQLLPRDVLTKSNGIVSAFVATRSGLLRMQSFDNRDPNPEYEKFHNKYPRSIDELFYKRAVDFYYHSNASKEAFVYSVPFDAGESSYAEGSPIVITATRAVMLGASDNQSAPVAVVGVQIDHKTFTQKFFNSTNNCEGQDCKFKCNSANESFDCFLLDNNGFILAVANNSETISPLVGKFFGEVDAAVFNQLIKYNIYKKVTIYDYQAVCFSIKAGQGSASILRNPFAAILRALLFILNSIVTNIGKLTLIDTQSWLYNPMRVFGYADGDEMIVADDTDNPHPGMAFTVLRPCDREVDLYIMANLGENPTFGNVHQCDVACNHTFIVQPIYDSNLILVAVPHACQHCERKKLRLEPRESTGMLADSNVTTACIKTPLDRQKPDSCYNYHAALFRSGEPICEEGYNYFYKRFACEKEMLKELDLKEQCGSSTTNSLSWPLLLLSSVLALMLQQPINRQEIR